MKRLDVVTANQKPIVRQVQTYTIFEGEKISVPTYLRKSNGDRMFYYHNVLFLTLRDIQTSSNVYVSVSGGLKISQMVFDPMYSPQSSRSAWSYGPDLSPLCLVF